MRARAFLGLAVTFGAVAALPAEAPAGDAAPAAVTEVSGYQPSGKYTVPWNQIVNRDDIQFFRKQWRGTFCGVYLQRERLGGVQENGDGLHAEEARALAPGFDRALAEAAQTPGITLDVVCNRTPCSDPSHGCPNILAGFAEKAQRAGVPLRFVFPGNYTGGKNPEFATDEAWVTEVTAAYGAQVRVGVQPGAKLTKQAKELLDWIARALAMAALAGGIFAGPSPDAQAAASPALAQTTHGGIDFSTLELRYLSERGDGVGYAFEADVRRGGRGSSAGLRVADAQSDAFFTWLVLRPEQFWVNLNPDEPNRIIDRKFARTDAGRILLEADLQMKKTTAELVHPDTRVGARFWRRLRTTADGRQCFSSRQWITPGVAKVRTNGDELYILNAPLVVNMEQQYLRSRGVAGIGNCPGLSKAAERHNDRLYRRLILSRINRAVIRAPEYAPLRQVYLSRVAAEWYRQRPNAGESTFGDLIDGGGVERWRSDKRWNPRSTYRRYVRSFREGEFRVTREVRRGNTIYTHFYTYGGVDFSRVPRRNLSDKAFRARWPGLERNVERSKDRIVVNRRSKEALIGGGAPLRPATPEPPARNEPAAPPQPATPAPEPGVGAPQPEQAAPEQAPPEGAEPAEPGSSSSFPWVTLAAVVALALAALGIWRTRSRH